ncbi:GNAT family N-acetyltransferase [Paenibacillus sp. FSL R7-0337]|uniref:GNAT family N-acetyltransferase n=1 Tax=Paenibacillus sp. FSL R7-0337 TaxID=1926588 RepID=UPI0009F8CD4D|nr:GNAT family N-acetyltransferase [Paenibacillus sp. FSL R7-0337]
MKIDASVIAARNIMDESQGKSYPTFAYSVLDRYIDGDIIIDKSSALIGISSGIYTVVGDETNDDFASRLLHEFKHRERLDQRFTLFSSSEGWDRRINELLGAKLQRLQRYSFTFNEQRFLQSGRAGMQEGFRLNRINEESLEGDREFDAAYIRKYWGSLERFADKGFGFFVTEREVIAGECVSIFSSEQYAEIDILTNPLYRGRGMAGCVAKAFILECLERQITPRWDCDLHNIASIRLAQKLNFTAPETYSLYARK